LIVITHAHQDYTGGPAAVKRRTGAPVLCHEAEAEFLKSGRNSRVVAHPRLVKTLMTMVKEKRVEAVEPDILVKDEEFSLNG